MNSFSMFWPIALVVFSNVVYHIVTKNMSNRIDPFAALTVVYLVAAVVSLLLYFLLNRDSNLIQEFKGINWAPFILGIAIVGLEAGFLVAYKNGWSVSMASIVQSSFLSIILIFVGWLCYHETLTWQKLVGAVFCMVGLMFINWK